MSALSSFIERFRAKKPAPEMVATIKAIVLAQLGSPEGTALAVNEIDCNDPACPGIETVILIMEPGRKTRACKIGKRMEEVSFADIEQALYNLQRETG